jgi:hypothetical protein
MADQEQKNLEFERFDTDAETPVYIEKKLLNGLPDDLLVSTWGVAPFWQLVIRRGAA